MIFQTVVIILMIQSLSETTLKLAWARTAALCTTGFTEQGFIIVDKLFFNKSHDK